MVPSLPQDPFFRANMYANFGDLGMAVKGLVDSASRWGAWAASGKKNSAGHQTFEELVDTKTQQKCTFVELGFRGSEG